MGFEVAIEADAGTRAGFSDEAYRQAGAEVVSSRADLWAGADIVLKVRPPVMSADATADEVQHIAEGATLVSFVWPGQNPSLVEALRVRRVTTIAVDAVPRITRAQKMDALSSMANIAGYRAVIEAAQHFGRFFTGQMTAAGKVPPAKVLIIGAGVAGLAAIGAAKALGAIVRAFDTRLAVKEQVESMGAEFLELEFDESGEGEGGYAKVMSDEFIAAEMALFREQAREVDIIITTALIPGKKAPVLITRDMVESMTRGSVVIDLAAEQGGNCELTKADEVVVHEGVSILGYTDLPSRMANQSSTLYANNVGHLLEEMGGAEEYRIDLENEVVRGALVTHDGEITWPAPKPAPPPPPAAGASTMSATASTRVGSPSGRPGGPTAPAGSTATKQVPARSVVPSIVALVTAVGLLALGSVAPSDFLAHLTVFVLAVFIGWQVIWNVSPALHTPLMSVTNAISGIIIVGGMLHQHDGDTGISLATALVAVAILIATINIVGGFLVTQRMLRMFRK
jgi:NAD(P) transhydrogenase subunit alpha